MGLVHVHKCETNISVQMRPKANASYPQHPRRGPQAAPLPITTTVQALISGCQLALDRSDAEVPKHGVNRRVYLTTAAL